MVNRQFRLIDLIDDMCNGKDVFFQLVRDVKDMMTYDVRTLTLDDSIGMCLKIMKENTMWALFLREMCFDRFLRIWEKSARKIRT